VTCLQRNDFSAGIKYRNTNDDHHVANFYWLDQLICTQVKIPQFSQLKQLFNAEGKLHHHQQVSFVPTHDNVTWTVSKADGSYL